MPTEELKKFSPEVIEKLGYYVYRLIDPRTGHTFYVGKGKRNRVFAHMQDALNNYDNEQYEDDGEDDESRKIRVIRDIKNAGLAVIPIIHRFGLTEEQALIVEAALIDCYSGLTNKQAGYCHEQGIINALTAQRDLSAEVFMDQPDLKYIIIKIKQYYLDTQGNGDVYQTVRKYWKVDLERANKVPFVLASLNGIIVEVFKVDKWYQSEDIPDRCEFSGCVAPDDIRMLFVNKRLPGKYCTKGMANPILYHD